MFGSRISGVVLCIVALALAGLFLWGLVARNYLALALPLGAGFLGVMALVFWVGWTLAATPASSPEKASPPEQK